MISRIPVTNVSSLPQAYELLSKQPKGLRILAGGTDLMVQVNARVQLDQIQHVLNIWGIRALRGIERRGDRLILGALTTYTELIQSPLVQQYFPALAEVSREVGAWAIQNRGTLGGNICNASPAGDTLPLLLAADAQFILGGPRGERAVAASDFFTGYRQTALAADELLLRAEVLLMERQRGDRLLYRKVGTRRAQSISRTILAARATINGSALSHVRIAAGSVAPTPIRCRAVENAVEGKSLDDKVIASARAALNQDIRPISDVRAGEDYRRKASANVLEYLLRELGKTFPSPSGRGSG